MYEGAVLRDNYRLERLLGRGGMASVYLAFDLRRQAYVAVKILREDLAEDPDFVRRFTREAEALARLNHPNVVRFYAFERQGATAFIVMDFIAGTTLQRRLAEHPGPLPLAEVTAILRQIGAAIQYAHSHGFIHRDIKPGNIMLRENGQALLSDFGIARVAESATQATVAMGTPAYMSPEQILGREIDQRADIYSLGVVLYEIAAGRRPFTGDERGLTETGTLARLREAHLKLPPPDPRHFNPTLPAGAAAVLMRALAKNPDERWPDVIEFVRAWEKAVGGEGAAALPTAAAVGSAGSGLTARAERPAAGSTPQPPTRTPAGHAPAAAQPMPKSLLWALAGAAATLGLVVVIALIIGVASRSSGRGGGAAIAPSPTATSREVSAVISTAVVPSPTRSEPTKTGSPASATPTRPRSPTPTVAPTPTPATDNIYLVTFANITDEWEESFDADAERMYINARYHILVKTAGITAWTTPGRYFDDFILEVEASQVAGPDDNGYGVLLRYVDNDNFYYFEISGNGYWEFTKQEDDEWATLIKWTRSDAIKQGKATNVIKVVCEAGRFVFYVNGVKVGELFDASFTEGDIGLAVSAYDVAGVQVAFDNLRVQPLR